MGPHVTGFQGAEFSSGVVDRRWFQSCGDARDSIYVSANQAALARPLAGCSVPDDHEIYGNLALLEPAAWLASWHEPGRTELPGQFWIGCQRVDL